MAHAAKHLIWVLVGAGVLYLAYGFYTEAATFVEGAEPAQGTVVDRFRDTTVSATQSIAYYPIVRFTTQAGQTVTFTGSVGSGEIEYAIGDTVQVYYQPENPDQARIRGFWSLWGGPLLIAVLGAVFVLAGIAPLMKQIFSRDS